MLHGEERRRLSRQCEAILERLKRAPATNRELSELSLKYTARISDLRQAGYNVQVIAHHRPTGVTTYALKPAAPRLEQIMLGF